MWTEFNSVIASNLQCPHCGEPAMWADDDQFSGEEEACDNCGFPGQVVGDLEVGPKWEASPLASAKCDCDDCPKCHVWRGFST